jgi:UDP-N-acetylmuramoyl-tripeptide--D-alanyl-D-alanine ligase
VRARSWAFDSRALDDGACFVALRGHRDGHDFVESAFHAGASVALVDHVPPTSLVPGSGRALVLVGDTVVALQDIARSVRADRGDLSVVAVAGSTGKTSTKDLLACVLGELGCHANVESFNNEFGLPITLCNTPASARVVVAEMGERLPGDLAALCAIAQPQVGVITNVGLAHAEHLGGHDGTAAVLGELLAALPRGGFAVLNADDPMTPKLAAHTDAKVITVGEAAVADCRMSDVRLDERIRASFTVEGHRMSLPLHGAHHVRNAAMAVAVARRIFALDLADISRALMGATSGRWRMELFETADGVIVLNDAYNANPTSMEAALVALAHLRVPGRRVAVLGDMRELGTHHDEAHVAVGRHAAEVGIDLLVGVGGGGAVIADAAETGGVRVERASDAHAALALIASLVGPGDAVLVKASRALGLERVADGLLDRGDVA